MPKSHEREVRYDEKKATLSKNGKAGTRGILHWRINENSEMNVTVTIDKIEEPGILAYAEFYFEATLTYGAINKPPKRVVGFRARTADGDASIFKYYESIISFEKTPYFLI